MRKHLLLLLAVTVAVTLGATAAFAALTFHAGMGSTEGDCAACHNNQAAAATRGWGSTTFPSEGTGWYNTNVLGITKLCYSCHNSTNSVNAHDVTTTAMADNNHQYSKANTPEFPNERAANQDNVTNSGMPYGGTSYIQCTSCHNVHNGDNRPFNNKTTIQLMCNACHDGRVNSAVGTADNLAGSPRYSTHPVNVTVADLSGNGSGNQFKTTIDAFLDEAFPASNVAWSLSGGRLTKTATGAGYATASQITCETCHAVHGRGTLSANSYTSVVGGVEDLLTINNEPSTQTALTSALCEGCHYGGRAGNAVGASGTTDHPIDNVLGRAFYPTGVADNTTWSGNSYSTYSVMTNNGSGSNLSPRCSSCHDTHGGAEGTSLLRSQTSPLTSAAGWCWSCHTASEIVPPLHHSARTTWSSSQIDCSGCHGPATPVGTVQQWQAHNGFGDFRVNADVPTTGAADTGFNFYSSTGVNQRTFQRMCESCHEPFDPTKFKSASGLTNSTGSNFPATHGVFAAANTGTHLVSDISGTTQRVVKDIDRTYNSFTRKEIWGQTSATFNNTGYRNQDILSKYLLIGGSGTVTNPGDNTNAVLVCESCHNLIYNAGVPSAADNVQAGFLSNLLLKPFADRGATSVTGTGADAGGFCRGCHNKGTWETSATTGAETYVHYPAAHTVISADYTYDTGLTPYGRATNTVMTTFDNNSCPNTSTADAAGAPGVFAWAGTNKVDCDSCHRVHNADAQAVAGATPTNPTLSTTRWWILEPGSVATAGAAKTESCSQCHDAGWNCGNK